MQVKGKDLETRMTAAESVCFSFRKDFDLKSNFLNLLFQSNNVCIIAIYETSY